jgi:hypothetical protein
MTTTTSTNIDRAAEIIDHVLTTEMRFDLVTPILDGLTEAGLLVEDEIVVEPMSDEDVEIIASATGLDPITVRGIVDLAEWRVRDHLRAPSQVS